MYESQQKVLAFYCYRFASLSIEVPKDDLNQAAAIGMIQALNRWDPQRGSWITCLFVWVRREIQNYTILQPIVYRPHGSGKPYKVLRAQEAIEARTGRPAKAEELGLTERKWNNMKSHECGGVVHKQDIEINDYGCDPETLLIAAQFEHAFEMLSAAETTVLLGPPCEAKEALRARFEPAS